MSISIQSGEQKKASAVHTIKAELATALTSAGLPARVYQVQMTRRPTPEELTALGATCVSEGTPIPSVKNGSIMYNFQGRGTLGGHECKVGGNSFLVGMHVDDATRTAYAKAKEERAKSIVQPTPKK